MPRTYPVRTKSTAEKFAIVRNWHSDLARSERQLALFRKRGRPAPLSGETEEGLIALVEESRTHLVRAEAEFGTLAELEALYAAEG